MKKPTSTKRRIIGFTILFLVLAALPFLTGSAYQMHLVIMTCINIMLGLSFALLYSTGLLSIGVAAFWESVPTLRPSLS